MAIALFGGSFDPPHSGHITVIYEALRSLPIERLIVVPAYVNPFKSGTHAPAALRLKWLKTIFDTEKNIEVSDFETAQGHPVRTIETVRHYLKEDPDIYLIIGADNLETLSKWHQFDELDRLVTWVVATRDQQKIDPHFQTLDVSEAVSSTQLRQTMKHEQLPKKVVNEIAIYYKEKHAATH